MGELARDLQLLAADLSATPYEVRRRLGRGGMGDVVEVWHRHLEQRMALKVLLTTVSHHDSARERFRSEAKALTRLVHDNLLRVTDLGETRSQRPFLVCELLEGESLGKLMKAEGPLPANVAIDYVVQALAGLQVAHDRGVIHRDIKPDNLFVCAPNSDGHRTIKVLDFGIAKYRENADNKMPTFAPKHATEVGVMVGTPHYTAPEQARSQPVDARTDIYAMGCVLFYLLTGRRVFEECNTLTELLYAHVRTPAEPPSRHAQPGVVSPALDAVVLRALEKDADKRYASAVALTEALQAVLPDAATPTPAAPNADKRSSTVKMVEVADARALTSTTVLGLAVAPPASSGDVPSDSAAPPTTPFPPSTASLPAAAPSPLAKRAPASTTPLSAVNLEPLAERAPPPTAKLPTPAESAARPAPPAPRPNGHAPSALPRNSAPAKRSAQAIYLGVGVAVFGVTWLLLWLAGWL